MDNPRIDDRACGNADDEASQGYRSRWQQRYPGLPVSALLPVDRVIRRRARPSCCLHRLSRGLL